MTDPMTMKLIEALIIIGILLLFKLLSTKTHIEQVEGRHTDFWCTCEGCTKERARAK